MGSPTHPVSKAPSTLTCANCVFSTKVVPYRVLYAFDPRRCAILLLGGDKTGDDRWYTVHVPIADKLYDAHIETLSKEGQING